MDFKPGDIVILKCGGHPMAVTDVKKDEIACVWMGTEGDLFRETLPVVVLERFVSPEDEEDDEEDED
jgi:uncharacterized protein YodC (DUF2158 family)